MSLTRAEKSRQVRSASKLGSINQDSLKSAIKMVKSASGSGANNKVNEQELFGALIYEGLGKINKGAQKSFIGNLSGFINEVSKFDAKNSVLRGVKRALKKLIDGKEIIRDAGRLLRQFALGKSQLDGDAERLSVKKKKSSKSVKKAVAQAKNNKKADAVQHFEFKQNNKAEFQKQAKKPKDPIETEAPASTSTEVDFEAEFKVRLENANNIKSLIEGPAQGYSEDNRFDAVREFFESEASANDGTVTERANEIRTMLLQNSPNVDQAIKDYMKDVFNIGIEFKANEKPDITEPPRDVDNAKLKFEAEFKLRQEKANVVKAFLEGPVEGYTNEERSDEVLDFFKSERNTLDESANERASEVYDSFIKASGREEEMQEVDALIKAYMKDIFNIEISFNS